MPSCAVERDGQVEQFRRSGHRRFSLSYAVTTSTLRCTRVIPGRGVPTRPVWLCPACSRDIRGMMPIAPSASGVPPPARLPRHLLMRQR
jgi:hypothetical protein